MPTDLKIDTDSLKSAQEAARTTASDGDSIAPRSVVRDSLKSQTARANGAQSRGPLTPQGRARSSANSLRHGFTAASVVLPTESSEDFQVLLDSYIDQFGPQGGVELDLVQTMTAARWRLRRICTIETTLLSNEMVRRAKDCKRDLNNPDDLARLAWVFRNLVSCLM